MSLRLMCALPNPGCAGAPRGLFYPDTPEGNARADEFAKQEDRPGWGVFRCLNPLRDDGDLQQIFERVLEENGFRTSRG
jgi:hypothetical protein